MKRICYIVECFPSLTESFILRELEELYSRGIHIIIFALRCSPSLNDSVAHNNLMTTIYCPQLYSPKLLLSCLRFFRQSSILCVKTIFFIVANSFLRPGELLSTLKHFPRAVYFARQIKSMGLEHIHAHFANLPTTLAMLASKLSSCTFSFSTHARDIYIPPSFFSNKFDLAEFIITCNKYNRRYLLNHFDGKYSDKIHRVYHGLDTKKYSSNHRAASSIDALEILFIKSETRPLVLSVGRLEKKKGQTYLLEACNLLKERGIDFVCCIAGDGSEKYSLIDQIYALNLRDVVHLPGALDEDSILNLYKRADVFALPCIQTNDGDHDGLPNVLIEALAMEVAVVTTEVGAIPELIEHEKTGILIPERNVAALAESLQYLIENDERRVQLAVRGREKVCKYFNIKNNIDPLIALFQRD